MRSFSLFAFALCFQALIHAQAPIYEPVELPVGGSFINDNNEAVAVTMQDGKEVISRWKDGITSITPAFGERIRISGFNNRGEIVGGIWYTGEWRGWHRTAEGEDRVLPGWSAEAINDRGDILGRGFDGKGFFISGDPPHTVTPIPGELRAINNAGLIVGITPQGAALWRQFTNQFELMRPLSSTNVQSGATPTDISQNGLIVGAFGLYNYDTQPGYWDGQTWRELAAPMQHGATATAVNSAGVIVGYQRFGPDNYGAAIWTTNGTGYNLATITRLSQGTNLYGATDINENGWIIAGGRILKPIGSIISLPELEVAEPTQPIQYTSNVLASVRFTKGSAPLAKVIYRVLSRTSSEGFSPGSPFRYTTWAHRDRAVTNPPFNLVITDLMPGQYFLSVEAVTEDGVAIYLPSRKFLVTGPAEIKLIRTRFDGTVDAGFTGSPGRLYTIEASDDMTAWNSVGLPPMRGGNFTLPPVADPAHRFYRLRVSSEDPDLFPRGYQVPTSLTISYEGDLILSPAGAATPIRFSYYWGHCEIQWPDRSGNFTGAYTFDSKDPIPKVTFTTPNLNGVISLQVPINRSDPAEQQFRAHFVTHTNTEVLTGTYKIQVQ